MIKNPLVSVVVLTYNSYNTILDTLDSIALQTYKNIELIISDDASQDDTIGRCRDWCNKNNNHFIRVEVIESNSNTGVACNCNRAISSVKGEWTKFIAGDDILLPDCIEKNIIHVNKNSNINVLFSNAIKFRTKNNTREYLDKVPYCEEITYFSLTSQQQLKQLYAECFLPAPTSFIKSDIFLKYNFDENYPYMEDWPYWIKLTSNGYQLSYMDEDTVLYRISESLSSNIKKFHNRLFMSSYLKFIETIKDSTMIYHPNIYNKRIIEKKMYYFNDILLNNKRNIFSRLLSRIYRTFILKCQNKNYPNKGQS